MGDYGCLCDALLEHLFQYLRPGNSGASVRDIENAISFVEKLQERKFNVPTFEIYSDLFSSQQEACKETFKKALVDEYWRRTGIPMPTYNHLAAKEVWKMLVADELAYKKIIPWSPVMEPIGFDTQPY